ncbi:MAG: hypothetical protein KC503_30655 [Myxococcales bacterium]|nr:hypothetical protein [Myxococcales bacterium]
MLEVIVVNDPMIGPVTHSIIYVSDPESPGSFIKIDFSPSSEQTNARRVAQEMVSMLAWPVRGKGNLERGFRRPYSNITQEISVSESVVRDFLQRVDSENHRARWNWYQAYTNNCQDHTRIMLGHLEAAIAAG